MSAFVFSDYKTIRDGGRTYLFLAPHNAIFEAEAETVGMLDRASRRMNGDPASRQAILDRFPGSKAEKAATFDRLEKIGLLHPAETSASGRTRPAVSRPMPIKTLVLHVTDACNLDCRYCYYHGGSDLSQARTMAPETARRAVDFLMDAAGPLDKTELVFFGGEPLLNMRLIADTVVYARRAAARCGKSVDFALTTNATLLTRRTTDFLADNHIGVTVSIDGLPEVHDRYRRFPDGSPSFAAVEPGIQRLLGRPSDKPVVARVTVAGDVESVPDSLDYLLGLGFVEAGFAPVTTTDPTYCLDDGKMQRLLVQFQRLAERLLARAREDRFYGFTNLVDLLVVLHEGEVKAHPCGAGLGMFSVATDGRLYLCQRLTDEADAAMGDIYQGVDIDRVEAFRQAARVTAKSECLKCWARTICAGGCYHEALVREGALTAPNLHYCDWIKRWIEIGLAAYGRLQRENPDYLDKLSALRGHAPLCASGNLGKGAA